MGYREGKKHHFRVKCKSILLSNEGKTMSEVAAFAEKTTRTVRSWFNSFEKEGIEAFSIKPGRGFKAVLDHLTDAEIKIVEHEVEQNYQSLHTVAANLSNKFGFKITKRMLKRFLKNETIHGAGFERG